MKDLVILILWFTWVLGIVVAKGFWMTLLAFVPLAGHIIAINWIVNTVVQ